MNITLPKLDTIGRYKMVNRKGMVPAEIVFAKVSDGDKIEFVTWERRLSDPAIKWGGHYFGTFREALSDFLKRIDNDGARS